METYGEDEPGSLQSPSMEADIEKLCSDIQQLSPHHSDDEFSREGSDSGHKIETRAYDISPHTSDSSNSDPNREYLNGGSERQFTKVAPGRSNLENSRSRQQCDRNSIFEIRFKCTKDNYRLSPECPPDLVVGDLVVVEADRGFDAGIVHAIHPAPASISPYLPSPTASLRHVVCRASDEDRALVDQNHREEERALQLCRHLAVVRHVPITVAATEMQFDRKKLTIIFASDRRVDFRELVRDVFQVFKTRIWMQKVSPAEAAALSFMFPTTPMSSSRDVPVPQARSSRPVFAPPARDEGPRRGGRGGYDSYRGAPPPPPRYRGDGGMYNPPPSAYGEDPYGYPPRGGGGGSRGGQMRESAGGHQPYYATGPGDSGRASGFSPVYAPPSAGGMDYRSAEREYTPRNLPAGYGKHLRDGRGSGEDSTDSALSAESSVWYPGVPTPSAPRGGDYDQYGGEASRGSVSYDPYASNYGSGYNFE